jgi:hypothetical protein
MLKNENHENYGSHENYESHENCESHGNYVNRVEQANYSFQMILRALKLMDSGLNSSVF